ncbi:MAG: PBSX family phage terminase large subunit [bacterium]|nr:PBSX family phage terminase large subunit [bacterium]
MENNRVSLKDAVGRGYKTFWRYRGRYRVVKGSRASKKSKTAALWYICNMMKYPEANTLVIRQTAATLKNSCFTELKWAINRLGVNNKWKATESPLELTYLPTGQKIYFRGLDDPLKVTSITVAVGCLCWLWIEEAYEIPNEEAFNTLDESIRGITPPGLFKQITLTFNPWNEHHWLKARFFDTKSDDILAITTNYMCNEWLDASDLAMFEDMKKNRPKRYKVAGLGDWGITDGIVYENWIVEDLTDLIPRFANRYYGLDFGVNDPNALICFDFEAGQKKIYVYDEFYQGNITLDVLAAEVIKRINASFVTCDASAKQNIIDLCSRGIAAIPAVKGNGSVEFGIQWLQGFDIIVDYRCKNFIKEISNYQWLKDKQGNILDKPVDKDNHLLDALRYGVEPLRFGNVR